MKCPKKVGRVNLHQQEHLRRTFQNATQPGLGVVRLPPRHILMLHRHVIITIMQAEANRKILLGGLSTNGLPGHSHQHLIAVSSLLRTMPKARIPRHPFSRNSLHCTPLPIRPYKAPELPCGQHRFVTLPWVNKKFHPITIT